MTKQEIDEKIVQIVAKIIEFEVINKDDIRKVDLIVDCGMDSMTFISLVVELEDIFSISIPADMLLMENFRKINDICSVIEKLI